jgi:hypothetical protein
LRTSVSKLGLYRNVESRMCFIQFCSYAYLPIVSKAGRGRCSPD